MEQQPLSLVDFHAEARTIVCLVRSDFTNKSWLWNKLSDSHFRFPAWSRAFKALRTFKSSSYNSQEVLPGTLDVDVSVVFDQEIRAALEQYNWRSMPLPNLEGQQVILDALEHFRKKRVASTLCEYLSSNVLQPEVAPSVIEQAVLRIEKDLVDLRLNPLQVEDHINHIGASNDDNMAYIRTLTDPNVPHVVSSGIQEFDERNGGFPIGGLVLLAGNTKGGKSIMAQDIARFAYMQGRSVALVGLELTKDQYYRRLISSIAEIDATRMMKSMLTPKEVDRIIETWIQFEDFGKQHGNRFTIFVPPGSATIESIIDVMKPLGHDMLIVDQPSCLEKKNGQQADWEHLKNATMAMKRYAQQNNRVAVAPVQVDEATDVIRYSRAQKENCDVLLQWHITPANLQKGYATIEVTSRDGEGGWKFKLRPDFKYSRWVTYVEAGAATAVAQANSGRLDMDMPSSVPTATLPPAQQQFAVTPSGAVFGAPGSGMPGDTQDGLNFALPGGPTTPPQIFQPEHISSIAPSGQPVAPVFNPAAGG